MLFLILFLLLTGISFGLILGDELVSNGDFDGNADGWTRSAFTYFSGYIQANSGGYALQSIDIEAGQSYLITYDATLLLDASVSGELGGATFAMEEGDGMQVMVTAGSSNSNIKLINVSPQPGASTIIDNVSVKLISANLNQDCIVNLLDFSMFAADWLAEDPNIADPNCDFNQDDIVDVNDLIIFVDQWLYGDPYCMYEAPTAYAGDETVYECVESWITLEALDEGEPDPPGALRYIITQLPSDANLMDPYAGNARITSVPYTLSGWGNNTLSFVSGTLGMDSFYFKANDGVNDSNSVVVDVNVIAFTDDSLTFDGDGYVTFADHAKYDITDGWAIDFWIKTRQPFAGLMDKRGTGKGWEIGIVSGKPTLYLYDASGGVQRFRTPFRCDTGVWHEVEFAFNYDAGDIEVYVKLAGWASQTYDSTGLSDYSNSEDLIVGTGYKYEIDALRFFSGIDNPTDAGDMVQGWFERTAGPGVGGESVFGLWAYSDVFYQLNEGTGTTVTDSKLSLTGTFSSGDHVLWQPPHRLWHSGAIQQYYRLNGGGR